MRKTLSIAAVAIIVGLGFAGTAQAQRDLPRLVERCLAGIRTEVGVTVEQINKICARTLETIETRIGEGDREGAEAAAREGAARIGRALARGERTIGDGVRRCIEILRRNGDRASARIVLAAAHEASDTMGTATRRCIARIREAIGGDQRPPEGDPPRNPPPRG